MAAEDKSCYPLVRMKLPLTDPHTYEVQGPEPAEGCIRQIEVECGIVELESGDNAYEHAYKPPKHGSVGEVFHDPVVIPKLFHFHFFRDFVLGFCWGFIIKKHPHRWGLRVIKLPAFGIKNEG